MLNGTLSGCVVGIPLVMSRWGESYAGGPWLFRLKRNICPPFRTRH
jgi:hypothetical protein